MKSKIICMVLIAVIALAAAAVCLSQLDIALPGRNSYGYYNAAATNYGLSGSYLSDNEILLADSVEKSDGSTQVSFRIFSLAEGLEAQDYLDLQAKDAAELEGLTEVGSAGCEFIGDDAKNIRNFKVSHNI